MPDNLEALIPLAAIVFAMGTVLVKHLLSHQRQMADLFQKANQQQGPSPDSLRMQQEILDLKQIVFQQSIALDDLKSKLAGDSGQGSVQERLTMVNIN